MKLIKQEIGKCIKEILADELSLDEIVGSIELTQEEFGDLAFPCFELAKLKGQNPALIAKDLASRINPNNIISSVEARGGFLNFYLNNDFVVQDTLESISSEEENYGSQNLGKGRLVVIDYSAPNIGKPLHVGHIRSTIIGDSLIRILRFTGYKTFGINYLGDIGLHIGKIITAYQLWGDKERMQQDPEKEVLDLYIKFNKRSEADSKLDEKAKQTLERLETGDKELTDLWNYIKEMSLKAFDRVYSLLEVSFDETTGQSKFSDLGKEQVKRALELGVARKDATGAVIVDLSKLKKPLPEKVILRSDGTAIYSTQDLGAAVDRYERFNFAKMLYIVANEQQLYFQQVFKTLELMGYDWGKDCFHVSFGMINLKEGRMSTREGVIVYLEEVLNKAIDTARKIIDERNPSLADKEQVARIVGIGAVKYMILGIDYKRDIDFSWERALNFEGDSAPYIQYGYARASSLLRKANLSSNDFNTSHLTHPAEVFLIKKLAVFPEIVEAAAKRYSPHIIANYAAELTGAFNKFYNNVPVIDSEEIKSRLFLVNAYRVVAKRALDLLGIRVPREM